MSDLRPFKEVQLQWLRLLLADTSLSPRAVQFATYLAVVRYNDNVGKAWPSHATVCEDLGLKSEKTIQRLIKELDGKWFEIRRGNGQKQSTEYVPSKTSHQAAQELREKEEAGKARELQDHYYEHVSLACGLTRTGPKRERLSRQQWRARKDAAKLAAQIRQEIDGRLEDVVDAEDGLERSLAAKAEEIVEKLDLADQALEEAEADRAEAQRLREQVARDAQSADAHIQRQLDQKQEALEALHRQQREAERADLHRARQEAEQEARRLRDAQALLNQDRADELRNAAKEAAHVVLELFLGVLDGSVRPRPDDPRIWIIRDDDLRERAKRLDLIELVKDTMKVLHDAWTQLCEWLSPPEQKEVSEQIAEPAKATFRQEPGNQP